jgi:hypothetical protein
MLKLTKIIYYINLTIMIWEFELILLKVKIDYLILQFYLINKHELLP